MDREQERQNESLDRTPNQDNNPRYPALVRVCIVFLSSSFPSYLEVRQRRDEHFVLVPVLRDPAELSASVDLPDVDLEDGRHAPGA
eukprot:795409-Rhodomonas_salina.1